MENDEIVNRVANSSLISLDLEDYYHKGERVVYDLAINLFQGLILKEKDFRDFVKHHDWTAYDGKNVAIVCTADAILPTWAYMLLISKLEPHANMVVAGDLADLEQALYQQAIAQIDFSKFKDARVVVKGCGKFPVPVFAYAELTRKLMPFAVSIMYGEPCSTVPVYKRSK
ncbi:MAG: DUF2480 family protein [Cytophagaceae bacterium]